MDGKPEPKVIDLRANSMFKKQPDGRVLVNIPPVQVIEMDDIILMDNPLRGLE